LRHCVIPPFDQCLADDGTVARSVIVRHPNCHRGSARAVRRPASTFQDKKIPASAAVFLTLTDRFPAPDYWRAPSFTERSNAIENLSV
jgi:hypothetical protein